MDPDVGGRPRAITVFGGSRIEPTHEDYRTAQTIGRLLAERGLAVVTGGYNGTMEAISRGAKEAGGQTIGVTVEILASSRTPNAWVDQEVKTAALLERIDKLIEFGTGYLVMPGGAGTLAELSVVWNLAMFGGLHGKPIVIFGPAWERLLRGMVAPPHLVEDDLRWLTFTGDAQSAIAALDPSISGG